MPKTFTADQLLERGRARTKTSDSSDGETSQHRDASQPELKYDRVTAYLTPEQREWVVEAAARASHGHRIRYSASDVIRLGIEKLQQLGDGEIAEALSVQAWTEAQRYPGRFKKGMPPKPPGWD